MPPSATRNAPSARRSRNVPSRSTSPGDCSAAPASGRPPRWSSENHAGRVDVTSAGSNAAGNDDVERAATASRRGRCAAAPSPLSHPAESRCRATARGGARSGSRSPIAVPTPLRPRGWYRGVRWVRSGSPRGSGSRVRRCAHGRRRRLRPPSTAGTGRRAARNTPSPSKSETYGPCVRSSVSVLPASSQISRALSSGKSYTRLAA